MKKTDPLQASDQTAPARRNHLSSRLTTRQSRKASSLPALKKRSVNKHKDIIENIQEGIFEVDLAGNFTFLNNAVCDVLGYSKKILIQTNSKRFTDPGDSLKVLRAYKKVFRTGEPLKAFGWHIITRDGTRKYVEGSIYLRTTSSGKPTGFRVIANDFTQRQYIEGKLHNEELRFRALSEQSSDIIQLIDLKGFIIYENKAVYNILGYAPEQRIGTRSFDYIHPDDLESNMKAFEDIFKDIHAPVLRSEIRIRHQNGTWRIFDEVASGLARKNVVESVIVYLRDITERKNFEDALRQSEEKYRNILENMQEGYFEGDLAGNYTFCNDALCKIHGYSKQELLGMNYRQYMDKETAKKAYRTFNKVYQTEKSISDIDWKIIRKDESRRHIDISVSLLKDSWSKPIGFRGVVRDITDRKEVEAQKEAAIEALRKSEKYFKEITENSSDILLIIDQKGHIKYCSRSAERFTGYKPEDILGRLVFDFVQADEVERAHRDYSKALLADENTLIHNAFRVVHKNGSQVYLDGMGRNLLNNPDIKGIVINVRDITDRKRAEDQLREEQQRFKALAEQSSEVIVLINRDGIITYENPAIEKALGFTSSERTGLSAFDLVHPDDLKIVTDSFKILFTQQNAPVQRSELRLRHKNGSWRTFDVAASNLVHNNKIEFAIINLHDITDRKKVLHSLQESKHRYRELSIIDDLTHLFNSRHFYIQLKKEIERSKRYQQPFTLLLMDLDKFKDYNDTYGHLEGDKVLSRFGKLIKRCLRENDSAYRYGGEEFTIMLPMTTYDEGVIFAQRIQSELSKENFSPRPNNPVHLTVSIGLSQYKPKEDIKTLVHRVDQLMYHVKKTERGQIYSDQEPLHHLT